MQLEILRRAKKAGPRRSQRRIYDLASRSKALNLSPDFRQLVIEPYGFKSFRIAKDSEGSYYLVFTKSGNDICYDYQIGVGKCKSRVTGHANFCEVIGISTKESRLFKLIPQEEFGSSTYRLIDVTQETDKAPMATTEDVLKQSEVMEENIIPKVVAPSAGVKLAEKKVASFLGFNKWADSLRIKKSATYDLTLTN